MWYLLARVERASESILNIYIKKSAHLEHIFVIKSHHKKAFLVNFF